MLIIAAHAVVITLFAKESAVFSIDSKKKIYTVSPTVCSVLAVITAFTGLLGHLYVVLPAAAVLCSWELMIKVVSIYRHRGNVNKEEVK